MSGTTRFVEAKDMDVFWSGTTSDNEGNHAPQEPDDNR
jgi:hypothetical protein